MTVHAVVVVTVWVVIVSVIIIVVVVLLLLLLLGLFTVFQISLLCQVQVCHHGLQPLPLLLQLQL